VDREAMARAQRRRQALDALEFERAREAELREQLEETVAEVEGDRLDEAAFAKMKPEEVEVVRSALAGGWTEEVVDDEPTDEYEVTFDEDAMVGGEDAVDSLEAEITRLQEELDECRRRQGALERYLAALGG
jgi:hypothetical protein